MSLSAVSSRDDVGTVAGVSGRTAQAAKSQLPELTSMRFFAAMAVLLGHFMPFLRWPSWASWMVGGFGVSFFFVLSGFILAYRYWEDFENGVKPRTYRRYFAARIARIYPSYVMALLLITALLLFLNALRPGSVMLPADITLSWLCNLLALQTFAPSYETQQVWNAPGWSISTEFGFYLVCPFILALLARHCRSRSRLVAVFGATVAFGAMIHTAILCLVIQRGWNSQFWLDLVASRNIFWRIPEFMTGVVAARLMYGGWLASLGGREPVRNGLLIGSLAVVAILNLAPWPADPMQVLVMRPYRLELAYMVPFAGIVVACAAGPTLLTPLLRPTPMIFLGEISYGVYIYHWIPWTAVSYVTAAGLALSPLKVWALVVATIAGSALSYLWLEAPARRFLRRALA